MLKRKARCFEPEYIEPIFPLRVRILAALPGGIARLKKMVPPPNGDAAPDISRFIPLKEGVTPEGVAYIQSCMLVDSDLAKNLYVPIMRQNRSLALQQGMCKQTIDAGIDIINRCADNTLSVEEMVDAGLITCNHTVALRLKSGRLLLYDPQRITHTMKAWIERLGGEVAYIVSPNPAHCLFTQSAMQAFPRAKLVASQQAADKMADLGISTAYNYSNPDRLNALWQDLVDEGVIPNVLAGDPAQIILLYHEKTRTLLEADLSYRDAFAPPKGLITPLMKRKVEIADTTFSKAWRACVCEVSPNRCSPVYRFASFNEKSILCQLAKPHPEYVVDREAMKISLGLLLKLPINRVLSAHQGEIDPQRWADAVLAEFAWL
ncbi:hypothetical protein CYMTET_54383 [Cymbomonas tetramitiformis]|uniref:Uncharacterized protein n=1 Tax=Cymbomonas tetramitiformis TaxID=36881 RepID=A0AAE0BFA5_9CHLO|nr:hypothetical protein CYMTET_54383 [Cymbomonas tetramitiformis]